MVLTERELEFRHFHFYCGAGGGALGFNRAHARVGRISGRMRCIGGVDVDEAGIADFTRLVGVPGTVLDLFTREMYVDFHGHEPPAGWREVTADDIRRAAGGERPHVVFFSAPCKGFSALLNSASAASRKYRALNRLVVRALELMVAAWGDDLPELVIFENVPRIMQRGRELLDDVHHVLGMAGYAVAETTHDCGVIGGLAQHRHRFLMVARLRSKVRPFLYEPPQRRVRAVGEVLEALPLPDDPRGGPMHRLPRLQWRTWVRLALIEAGSDWRSLAKLEVVDGHLRDLGIAPMCPRDFGAGPLGVVPWASPMGTIAGESRPTNNAYSVADPRAPRDLGRYEPYGVVGWDEVGRTVTGEAAPGAGPYSVADPRATSEWSGKGRYPVTGWNESTGAVIGASTTGTGATGIADPRLESYGEHHGKLRVEGWADPAHTVTGSDRVGSGAMSVADPRLPCDVDDREHRRFNNVYRIVRWTDPAQAVTGGGAPGSGGQAVADPRLGWSKREGQAFGGAGARHYGVLRWEDTSPAVTGSACHDNGAHSIADPRLPEPTERGCPVIISLDGTRHRPFTTWELAGIQGFPIVGEDALVLDGASDSAWRERIGNAVPPPAAEAIGSTMLETLLRAAAGEAFSLSNSPIWVDRRLALALSVDLPETLP